MKILKAAPHVLFVVWVIWSLVIIIPMYSRIYTNSFYIPLSTSSTSVGAYNENYKYDAANTDKTASNKLFISLGYAYAIFAGLFTLANTSRKFKLGIAIIAAMSLSIVWFLLSTFIGPILGFGGAEFAFVVSNVIGTVSFIFIMRYLNPSTTKFNMKLLLLAVGLSTLVACILGIQLGGGMGMEINTEGNLNMAIGCLIWQAFMTYILYLRLTSLSLPVNTADPNTVYNN